jgi:hypothetical protein
MAINKNQLISRRAAMTKTYQKPSLSKMKGLYDAAALAASNMPPITP